MFGYPQLRKKGPGSILLSELNIPESVPDAI